MPQFQKVSSYPRKEAPACPSSQIEKYLSNFAQNELNYSPGCATFTLLFAAAKLCDDCLAFSFFFLLRFVHRKKNLGDPSGDALYGTPKCGWGKVYDKLGRRKTLIIENGQVERCRVRAFCVPSEFALGSEGSVKVSGSAIIPSTPKASSECSFVTWCFGVCRIRDKG